MSSIIHDVAKILYSREGYLPDYPYHMISDREMFDAFINNENNYFADNYPCPDDEEFAEIYENILEKIRYHIRQYLEDDTYVVPNWLYSYMLGGVIGINSDERDRRDYIELLGLPSNPTNEFTEEVYWESYSMSEDVISKLPADVAKYRPITIFGEPDVVKQLKIYRAI